MSVDLVTFNVRYEKSRIQLKMELPSNVYLFTEKLKTELKIDDTKEIMILCPTSEGLMMEIESDDDIAFLKKTKLSFNSESKEIYCSAELVLCIIPKQLVDDPQMQLMVLSNQVNQLIKSFAKVTQSLEHKIDENTDALRNDLKSILIEHLKPTSNDSLETNSLGEHLASSFSSKQKKPKKKTDKLSSTITDTNKKNDVPTINDNLPKSHGNINVEETSTDTNKKTKDIDSLLEMLVANGFTNTIQNIIVLKRFNNDYEKVIEYLKNSV